MGWHDIAARLEKAEADASDWREGLEAAEAEVKELQRELMEALGLSKGAKPAAVVARMTNGGNSHRPAHRPPPPIAGPTKDYDRRHRALTLMREKGGFLSGQELSRLDKCPPPVAASVLKRLADEGVIHRVARGRYALGPAASAVPKAET